MWLASKPESWNGDVATVLAHGAGQGMSSPFMTFFHLELSARGYLSVKFNFDYIDRTEKRNFDLSDANLRIDTFRTEYDAASANQSGIRVTHIPTDLAISSDSETSQPANLAKAMAELQAHMNTLQKKKFGGAPDPQPKLQATYRRVIEDVRLSHNPKRLIIGGKSMGGRVASDVAGASDGIAGLIFLGYPLHPPSRPDQMRDKHLYGIPAPMLFISGTKDTFARRELLQDVVDRIGTRATLKWIEGGDHSFKVRKGGEDTLHGAANTIHEWIESL